MVERAFEQCALIITLSFNLQRLEIHAQEVAFSFASGLPTALMQCQNLTRLILWDICGTVADEEVLRRLSFMQAPLEYLTMSGLESLPFSPFDILANFCITLKALDLCGASLSRHDLSGKCWPRLKLLVLPSVAVHLDTVEMAFPNVLTVRGSKAGF